MLHKRHRQHGLNRSIVPMYCVLILGLLLASCVGNVIRRGTSLAVARTSVKIMDRLPTHTLMVRLWCHLLPTSPSTLIDRTRIRPVYIAMSRPAELDSIECVATRATIATVRHAKVGNQPIRTTLHPGTPSLRIIVDGAVMMGTLKRVMARACHAQTTSR